MSIQGNHSALIPENTVFRARWYLEILEEFANRGLSTISSWEIAQQVGVKSALVRKDLSFFGVLGTRNVGYQIQTLKDRIQQCLHMDETKSVIWLGVSLLMDHPVFQKQIRQMNCELKAVLDYDEKRIGQTIAGHQVQPLSSLQQVVEDSKFDAAVLFLPKDEAQLAADHLVRAGIRSMLNLCSYPISVPEDVLLRQVDLINELFVISYFGKSEPK